MFRKSKINRTHSEMIPDAFDACQTGDVNALQAMLNNGVSVDLNNGMDSLISESVSSGQHEVVDLLIKGGANVNFVDGFSETPLMVAVKKQDLRMVSKLIAAGADVNFVHPNNDRSVLLDAAYSGDEEICVELIKNDAKWWLSPLGHYLELPMLLAIKCGSVFAAISSRENWYKKRSKKGMTFAHCASFLDRADLLQPAIEAGASIHATEKVHGSTLLHLAFLGNSADCVSYLLNAGANVHATNKFGVTPIQFGIDNKKAHAVVAYMKFKGLSPLDKVTKSVCKKYKGRTLLDLFATSDYALSTLKTLSQPYQSKNAADAIGAIFLGDLAPKDAAAEQPLQRRLSAMQL